MARGALSLSTAQTFPLIVTLSKAPPKRLLTKRKKELGTKWSEANYKRGWYQVGRKTKEKK